MNKQKRLQDDQQGLVAIFTVLIIMGILALLTIGFANIARHAQRRTLDDQLNTQAFYAAETGINRAQTLINNGTITADKGQCLDNDAAFNYTVDATLGIGISCLLVDMTPTSIEYGSVPEIGTDESITTYVDTLDDIDYFQIAWDSEDASDMQNPNTRPNSQILPGQSPSLETKAAWAEKIGILRVDLIRAPNATSLVRATMVNDSYTFFLYPSSIGTPNNSMTANPNHNNQGSSLSTHCDPTSTTYRCQVRVNLGGTPSDRYYVRLQSYYNPTRVSLSPFADGNPQEIQGSQAVIDSTGRVSGVSRRMQVRVPIRNENNSYPGYHEPFSILSASSLCKRIVGVPSASTYLSDAVPASDQALCNPASP